MKSIGFLKAKRHLEYQSEEAKLGQDVDGCYPFLIQCKSTVNFPSPQKVLKQIMPVKGAYKLGVIKQTNKGTYAVMKWDEFLEILEMLKQNKII